MSICHDWKAQLLVEYSKDCWACKILEGSYADERYRVMDEVIYYKGRIFLVSGSELKERILHATHDSPLSGHQGFRKTYMAVRECFTWKGLKGDVLRHVQECEVCQRSKGELTHPAGLLQPLPIPEGKWESISMDFITGLPLVQGKDCIFCSGRPVDQVCTLLCHTDMIFSLTNGKVVLQGGLSFARTP